MIGDWTRDEPVGRRRLRLVAASVRGAAAGRRAVGRPQPRFGPVAPPPGPSRRRPRPPRAGRPASKPRGKRRRRSASQPADRRHGGRAHLRRRPAPGLDAAGARPPARGTRQGDVLRGRRRRSAAPRVGARGSSREGHTAVQPQLASRARPRHASPPRRSAPTCSRTNDEIRRAVPGAKIPYFRQPGGKWTPAGGGGRPRAGHDARWTGTSTRATGTSTDRPPDRTRGCSRQARPGSIILLHDGGGDRHGTLAACRRLIPT